MQRQDARLKKKRSRTQGVQAEREKQLAKRAKKNAANEKKGKKQATVTVDPVALNTTGIATVPKSKSFSSHSSLISIVNADFFPRSLVKSADSARRLPILILPQQLPRLQLNLNKRPKPRTASPFLSEFFPFQVKKTNIALFPQ